MTTPEDSTDRHSATDRDTAAVSAWLAQHFGGPVVQISRQPRWRPVWFATISTADGTQRNVVVRGDRTDMTLIFPLRHEMTLQSMMFEAGIPVAEVHGWIDEPMAYVMDAVPGRNDFAKSTEAERDAVVDHYLQILAELHSLDVEPFAAAGISRAATPAQSGLLGASAYERNWRTMKADPDPFTEWCLGWWKRNAPDSRGREAVIVWDSGQFHHRDGRVQAVLDVEIGHIGDPMMDLAAWRSRDTIIGYGDFNTLYARYEQLSGREVDIDAIMRHHFFLTLTNQLSVGPSTRRPGVDTDLMTNLQWCCETNLFATEAIAQIVGADLPEVDLPEPALSRTAVVAEHLVGRLRSVDIADEFVNYQLRTMFRTARHLARRVEIGEQLEADDIADLTVLLGHRPASWTEGAADLERFVLADAAAGNHDRALLELFHKRNLRAHMLLGPAGSAMTRHNPPQPFR